MNEEKQTITSFEQYYSQFPPSTVQLLQGLRELICSVIPEAKEKISYGMPTFALHRNVIHFAAYAKHIGLYPGPKAVEHFSGRLKDYKCAKGTIQFPLDKPLPNELIIEIVNYCVKQQEEKLKEKKLKKEK